jgi:dTMP kinase
MKARGIFIVFEGIDGSGKSSCIRDVAEELSLQHEVIITAEPSEGPIGMMLRDEKEKLPPMAESLLFVADRAHHTDQIKKWLKAGKIVFCDRYYASTLAYQSSSLNGNSGELDWLWEINRPVISEPDITFLFDVPPEIGLERTGGRDQVSKFENREFLSRVRATYLDIAEERGFVIIDARRKAIEVRLEVREIIRKKLEV